MVNPIWNKLFLCWNLWAPIDRLIFSLLSRSSDHQMGEGLMAKFFLPWLFRHEIVGEVTEVGSEVKAFKVGEIVGVGCMVNSCQTCDSCTRHLEQYCLKKVIWTYSEKDYDGTLMQGGYSTIMVCKQEYVILILCVTLILYIEYAQIKSLKL